jgi:hypothetical protein
VGRRPPPMPACAHIILKEFHEEGNLKGKNIPKNITSTARRRKAGPKQRMLTAKREQRGRRHLAQAASDLSATLERAATCSAGGSTGCVATVFGGACTSLPAFVTACTPLLSCLHSQRRGCESRARRQRVGGVRIFHVGIAGFHK